VLTIVERTDRFHKILNNYLGSCYPGYNFVYVQGIRHYRKILKNFNTPTDIIVLQIEESLFDDNYDMLLQERDKLHKSSIWTEKSFIITNSKKDYELCKDRFRIECKPGFFDLLCFSDNVVNDLNIDDVRFYTGAAYNNNHIGRSQIVYYMKKFIDNDKISFLKFRDKILIKNVHAVAFGGVTLSPVPTGYDKWIQNNVFHTAFENYHHGIDPDNNFSPTLSEKTFKAMHLMRPCLSFGGPGTRIRLKQLGFDTWDWLIDWSFDEEQDYEKSFKLFLLELSRLCEMNLQYLKELLVKNRPSLEHNKKHINFLIKNYNQIQL